MSTCESERQTYKVRGAKRVETRVRENSKRTKDRQKTNHVMFGEMHHMVVYHHVSADVFVFLSFYSLQTWVA